MALQYINRVGKTYYLRQGTTKTGKPRYFFTARQDGKGEALAELPEGYEIYEHPENAQVFLRKRRPQLITDLEEQLLEKRLDAVESSRRYLVDRKDRCITVYESNNDTSALKGIFGDFLSKAPAGAGLPTGDALSALVNVADHHYTAVLRFCLRDAEKRTFTAERFCFRGAVDGWIHLGAPDGFSTLVEKWLSVLGQDEFFDSPYF